MEKIPEETQRREIEARERVRRISTIVDEITIAGVWKAAEEIDDLRRKVLALEAQVTT